MRVSDPNDVMPGGEAMRHLILYCTMKTRTELMASLGIHPSPKNTTVAMHQKEEGEKPLSCDSRKQMAAFGPPPHLGRRLVT